MSRRSYKTRVREVVLARLLRGEIALEDRLVDHVIAAEMGVSRMPVREALAQLASEGYLAATSRGFALPDLSPDRIHDVFVLRRLLEPHAAACAARDRGESVLQDMRDALDAARVAAAAHDAGAFHRASEVFRNAWLSSVQNEELRHAIQRYSGQIQAVRLATVPDPSARETILDGLAAQLAAIEARDSPGAADLMRRFIYNAETSYLRHCEQNPAPRQLIDTGVSTHD
jgi:DNA-binding GntR family transcriptional regulator